MWCIIILFIILFILKFLIIIYFNLFVIEGLGEFIERMVGFLVYVFNIIFKNDGYFCYYDELFN